MRLFYFRQRIIKQKSFVLISARKRLKYDETQPMSSLHNHAEDFVPSDRIMPSENGRDTVQGNGSETER